MAEETTDYRVKADLVLDATKARGQAVQMQQRIMDLGRRIRGTSSLAGGLTRNLIAVGGAYVGINALAGAFTRATHGATAYASELEKTRIGLTSVLAAVKGTDWETAQRTAGTVFEQMRQDSIKSVATAQQLFTLYQGIVGPISQAGFGLETVRNMTLSAVSASGVLGVDLEQSQRDMSLMVRGAAGMDVKLFSLLRSTGAIAETTEQWNKSLTAQERVDKLQEALNKFAPAGDKFATSWGGVTSTFKGIQQEFTRSAWQPVMDSMARALGRLNTILIDNQASIQDGLKKWGENLAATLDRVFERATNGVQYAIDNWDALLQRAERFQRIMGGVGHAAMIGAGVQAARPALGATVEGVGAAAGALGVGGGAAGAAVGAAAAAFAGAALVVREQWNAFTSIFQSLRPVMMGLWVDLQALGGAMWETLAPVLKVLGNIVMAQVVPTFTAAVAVFRLVVRGWREIFGVLKKVSDAVYDFVKPAFDQLWLAIDHFVSLIVGLMERVTGDVLRFNRAVGVSDEDVLDDLAKRFGQADYVPPWDPRNFEQQAQTPGGRSVTVNDFRGSRIQVKQDFRDQDPDRVLIGMIEGINRQADMRIQSGMVPALGR